MYFVTLKLTEWWGVAITNGSFSFLAQSPGMGESVESTILARCRESMILPLGKLRQEEHGCMKPDWTT